MGSFPVLWDNMEPFTIQALPSSECISVFPCLPPFPRAGFASPPSVVFRQLGTMLALTPRGFGHSALRLPTPLAALFRRAGVAPGAVDGCCHAVHHPAHLLDGSATARSPRVMRMASLPRHPAPHARAESGDVRCSRFAGGFTIARGLAASRVPCPRVHFRYGSAVCLSALRPGEAFARDGALEILCAAARGDSRVPAYRGLGRLYGRVVRTRLFSA